MGEIRFFSDSDEFYELSNFYGLGDPNFHLSIDGIDFATSEHAYQCKKFERGKDRYTDEYIDLIASASTPLKAKYLAGQRAFGGQRSKWRVSQDDPRIIDDLIREYKNRVSIRNDWEIIKVDVMREIVLQKFSQNPHLSKLLLSTYPKHLMEDSRYDDFWGIGPKGNGKNLLGRILEDTRDLLLSKKESVILDIDEQYLIGLSQAVRKNLFDISKGCGRNRIRNIGRTNNQILIYSPRGRQIVKEIVENSM